MGTLWGMRSSTLSVTDGVTGLLWGLE
jgi:hypothetical protein